MPHHQHRSSSQYFRAEVDRTSTDGGASDVLSLDSVKPVDTTLENLMGLNPDTQPEDEAFPATSEEPEFEYQDTQVLS